MSSSSDEEYYGPALPPKILTHASDNKSSVGKETSKDKTKLSQSHTDCRVAKHKDPDTEDISRNSPTKRVIGPTMPADFTQISKHTLLENDEKDVIVKDASHDWMAGMNERLKLSLEHVSERDLQRKLKREGGKKNDHRPVIGPAEEREHHYVEDRGPSLMEIHQRMRLEKKLSSKRPDSSVSSGSHRDGRSSSGSGSHNDRRSYHSSREDAAPPYKRKEFDPAEDLKIPRFDSKRSREMLKEAKKVQDRFGAPSWL